MGNGIRGVAVTGLKPAITGMFWIILGKVTFALKMLYLICRLLSK
jgi:hypothetical protein